MIKEFSIKSEKNYNAVMTSKKCLTGTDRVAEVSKKLTQEFILMFREMSL